MNGMTAGEFILPCSEHRNKEGMKEYETIGKSIAPFFLQQDSREALHRSGYANIDVLGPAPTAPQVDGPAAEEGVEDGVAPEQGDEEAGGEAEVLRRGAARGVVQVGKPIGVVNLRRRLSALFHLSKFRSFSGVPPRPRAPVFGGGGTLSLFSSFITFGGIFLSPSWDPPQIGHSPGLCCEVVPMEVGGK